MKKILMTVALLATVASVQSASIFWGGYIANSQNLPDMYLSAGSYMTLIYLGVAEPVGSVTEWDKNTGLSNLGGTVLDTYSFTAGEIANWDATATFVRSDANGGVNGYWMTVIYDPNATADYFGYDIAQVSGVTDETGAGTVKLNAGWNSGEYLDGGAQLQVVPEPATGMLALAGAALLLRRRRRA